MAAAASSVLLPHSQTITYPHRVKSVKDRKTYKHQLLRTHPEILMADYCQKGDTSTITNLLLYTENGNAWHKAICLYYKNFKQHSICNGRQIQIHDKESDTTFLTVNIYHNGTTTFQGNETCLISVQDQFNELQSLEEQEREPGRADSSVKGRISRLELDLELEEPVLELGQSVTQIRNSLSLQEVELVELRELVLSQTTCNKRLQQLTQEYKDSVEELRGEIKKLQQDKNT